MKKLLIALLLGAGMAAAQDCDTSGGDTADCKTVKECKPVGTATAATLHDGLNKARADLRIQRTEFKRLARVEQTIMRDARTVVYKDCPHGRSLARNYGAAADLMEAAAAQAKASGSGHATLAKLCADMAESYRAVAKTIDRRERYLDETLRSQDPAVRANATFRAALQANKDAAAEAGKWDAAKKAEVAEAWKFIKKGDPQFRAFGRNMKALADCWKAVDGATAGDSAPAGLLQTLAKAKNLTGTLAAHFEGVDIKRPAPEPAQVPS